jgi:hypothetical protein
MRNKRYHNVLAGICEKATAGSLLVAMFQGNLKALLVTALSLIFTLLLTWLTPD